MAETDWKRALCPGDRSTSEALAVLDRAGMQICLIVDDDNRLIGVMTDGDFRRLVLSGADLSQPVANVAVRRFVSVGAEATRDEVIGVFRSTKVHQIPVLDGNGFIVGLHTVDEILKGPRRSTRVVIMAGGLGTRLGKLTERVPKPMIHVAGRPILEVVLDRLRQQGFCSATLCVGYLREQIIEHFGDGSRYDIEIDYVEESTPRGTAGSLAHLSSKPLEPFVVMNADLITSIDLGLVVDSHLASEAAITVVTRPYEMSIPFGVIDHENGRIVAVREKPTVNFDVSTGIYVVDPLLIDLIPTNERFDMPELIHEAVKVGRTCRTHMVSEYWVDVGRVEELERVRRDLESGEG